MVHFVSVILAVSLFITQSTESDQVLGKPLTARLANVSVQSQLRGSSVTSVDSAASASPSVSLKEKMEMNSSGNGRGWGNDIGNGSLVKEEDEDCIFTQYYWKGADPGDYPAGRRGSGETLCEDGVAGWSGGDAADYCYDFGKKRCYKGYKCRAKHLFDQDRNCCRGYTETNCPYKR